LLRQRFQVLPLDLDVCGKIADGIVHRVHKQALRILLDDHESTFEALLAKNDEINIHTQNLCVLMIEIYKTLNNTNPLIMQDYFVRKYVKYDLRTRDLLQIPAAKSIESVKFRCSLLWNSTPDLIKGASCVAIFKRIY